VKAGFDQRFSNGNTASDPLLERALRPQRYQSRLWILAVPLFEWSLNGSKLISIHMHLFWPRQLCDLFSVAAAPH
jgi:hypothetical protein